MNVVALEEGDASRKTGAVRFFRQADGGEGAGENVALYHVQSVHGKTTLAARLIAAHKSAVCPAGFQNLLYAAREFR